MHTDGQKCCSRCGKPRDRKNQRYCRACHKLYMQDVRAGKVQALLTPEEWAFICKWREVRAEASGPASAPEDAGRAVTGPGQPEHGPATRSAESSGGRG